MLNIWKVSCHNFSLEMRYGFLALRGAKLGPAGLLGQRCPQHKARQFFGQAHKGKKEEKLFAILSRYL